MQVSCQVSAADNGHRAVDVLCRQTGMSRLMAKKIRLYGSLTCNGTHHRMIDPVHTGDILVASLSSEAKKPASLREVPGAPLIYKDNWLIVVAKPTNMVIHPTYLHHEGSLTHLLSDLPLHPVIRLDRDTSGAVLIALNGHAHYVLSQNAMEKYYIAIVHGKPDQDTGLIDAPIGRTDGSIMLREVRPDGDAAQTAYEVIRYYQSHDVTLMRFRLLTGRTHQIRVHSRHIGHPLVGDSLYGYMGTNKESEIDGQIGRQALHAAVLVFTHPESFEPVRITAPFPDDFRHLLKYLHDHRTNDT